MTITEKILAKHSGRNSVQPGDNVWIDVDVLMTPRCVRPERLEFSKGIRANAKFWDKYKLVLFPTIIFTCVRMR